MKNQNSNSERHTIEDVLMFSLKKIYSGCMFDGPHAASFKKYFEYFLKRIGKQYLSTHCQIGCSLIPFILVKDLELYFNGRKHDFNNDLKFELMRTMHDTYLYIGGSILYTHFVNRSSNSDNFFADKPELFEAVMTLMKELFKINLLHFDTYKFYETFVMKTKIKNFDEFSSSVNSTTLWDNFLYLLNLSVLSITDFYPILLRDVRGVDKSLRLGVKLSLVALAYMLKICKKLLREYKENVTKINKDLRLIYVILVFSVIPHYILIIFQCLNDIIYASKKYKIKDKNMGKIIKISMNILRDCYRTMFVARNRIWPEVKASNYIYSKFSEMWKLTISELEEFHKKYLSEENKYDKSEGLWYLKDIVGVSNIMRRALDTIG